MSPIDLDPTRRLVDPDRDTPEMQALPHSTLAYISPMQFEENWLANQPRQASP